MFRKKLFGYHPTQVDDFIERKDTQILEKSRRITELEQQIRQLEFALEDRDAQIYVLEEINKSKTKSEMIVK